MIYGRISRREKRFNLFRSHESIIADSNCSCTPTEEIKTDISIRGKSFRYFYSRNIPIGRIFVVSYNVAVRIEIIYSCVTCIVALRNGRVNRRESILNCKNKVFTCLVSYTVDTEISAFTTLRDCFNLFRSRSVFSVVSHCSAVDYPVARNNSFPLVYIVCRIESYSVKLVEHIAHRVSYSHRTIYTVLVRLNLGSSYTRHIGFAIL